MEVIGYVTHVVSVLFPAAIVLCGIAGLSGLVSPSLREDPRDEIMRKYIIIM